MTADSSPERPWPAVLAIGAAAELLFLINLARPSTPVFDETHYVPAARMLMTLAEPANIEHPLIGKLLIALGIELFGDNSFGWRFFSTLAATAVVMGVFAIGWQLLGRVRPAAYAALFVVLNFTVFIQARIAMLDGFMAAFVIGAIAALLWAMRGAPRSVPARLAVGGILLGLAMGTKWVAVPYFGFALMAILLIRLRDARLANRPLGAALGATGQAHFAGIATLPAVLIVAVTGIGVYLLTFLPAFFYRFQPMTLATLLPFQLTIYVQQTQALPPHPYQSAWWTWPLDLRPIWYLYEPVDGAVRGILLIGNPAIMSGGLVAVLACLYGAVRDRSPQLLAVAALWIGSIAIWAIIPKKIGFFYYYYLSSIFLGLALAAAFDRFGKARLKYGMETFALLSFALFAYFYPIISAAPLANDQAFLRWMWLSSWP
ncbi:MAG: dolichyl-phosphate-mannose--protein mannosyltransferase [Sphingomonas sp. 28-66-16]|nr:MAG: dolichyl-phosphate-mannose--protein mannosyltransferase [Sphingomonas sp. 28-66-16]